MSMFLTNAARGFTSDFDDTPEGMGQYTVYCEATHRVLIWVDDKFEQPIVFLDSGTCYEPFSVKTQDRLAKLAQRHGALEPDVDDLCAFRFHSVENAERFATAAADWLRANGLFEPPKPIRQHVGPIVEFLHYHDNRRGC